MEVELMVTKRDDDRQPTDNRQGEYRAICHGKVGRQSFAIEKKMEVQRKEILGSSTVGLHCKSWKSAGFSCRKHFRLGHLS